MQTGISKNTLQTKNTKIGSKICLDFWFKNPFWTEAPKPCTETCRCEYMHFLKPSRLRTSREVMRSRMSSSQPPAWPFWTTPGGGNLAFWDPKECWLGQLCRPNIAVRRKALVRVAVAEVAGFRAEDDLIPCRGQGAGKYVVRPDKKKSGNYPKNARITIVWKIKRGKMRALWLPLRNTQMIENKALKPITVAVMWYKFWVNYTLNVCHIYASCVVPVFVHMKNIFPHFLLGSYSWPSEAFFRWSESFAPGSQVLAFHVLIRSPT